MSHQASIANVACGVDCLCLKLDALSPYCYNNIHKAVIDELCTSITLYNHDGGILFDSEPLVKSFDRFKSITFVS